MPVGVQWSDSLETGFRPLDEQHRRIFDASCEIDGLIGAARPDAEIIPRVRRLRRMLAAHFRFEERLMANLGDPTYTDSFATHKAAHRDVLRILDRIGDKLAASRSVRPDMSSFEASLFKSVVVNDGDLILALVHAGTLSIADMH